MGTGSTYRWPTHYLTDSQKSSCISRGFGFISRLSHQMTLERESKIIIDEPNEKRMNLKRIAIRMNSESTQKRHRKDFISMDDLSISLETNMSPIHSKHGKKGLPDLNLAVTPSRTTNFKQDLIHKNSYKTLASSLGSCTGLEKIVQDYFREKHRKCVDPVTIVSPFSFSKKHQCVSDRIASSARASINTLNRLNHREICGKYAGGGQSQDVRFIHSRSKWVKSFRNIYRNDDIEGQGDNGLDEIETSEWSTSLAFFRYSPYEDILVGTSAGDLVLRNSHTCRTFAKWKVHEKAILSIAVTPDGSRVLTCASAQGEANLSRFPDSIIKDYDSTGDERQYTYSTVKRNRQEDELDLLWDQQNVADIELDSSGKYVVTTLLNPEHDGHEHAAIICDLGTGNEIVKLNNPKLSSCYWWHRASFAPDSANTVLHDGLLWDVRSRKVIHKFDKLSDYGRCTFRPDGTQVVLDGSVWDIRTFKLFVTTPIFEAAIVMFDSKSSVAYSYRPLIGKYKEDKIYSSYSVTDVSDYSTITTNELDPLTIQGMALNPTAERFAIITDKLSDEIQGKQRNIRLYEVGWQWSSQDQDTSDEEDDSSEDDDSSGDSDEGINAFFAENEDDEDYIDNSNFLEAEYYVA